MRFKKVTLSDESIRALASQIIALQRVGYVENDGDSGRGGDSGENAGFMEEDNAALLQRLKLGHELRGPLVSGSDLRSGDVNDGHDSSSRVAAPVLVTPESTKPTLEEHSDTSSLGGVSEAPAIPAGSTREEQAS